jgi:heat shock protein HtpX
MIYREISSNKWRSALLIGVFVALILAVGYVFGEMLYPDYGFYILPAAVAFSLLSSVGSYYWSDKIVLAMNGARPADSREFPYLVNTVEGLAIAAGMPMPKTYVIDDPSPNAFATGRDPEHAVICATTGLLDKMDRLELEGVLAHEMSHIKNYDIRFSMLAAVLAGTIVFMSHWMTRSFFWGGGGRRRSNNDSGGGSVQGIFMIVGLVLMILAPIFATMLQLAISRKREFLADASGAILSRNPDGLADALVKISGDPTPVKHANGATAHLYIVNPFKGGGRSMANLFSTHPPIEERVRRLRAM